MCFSLTGWCGKDEWSSKIEYPIKKYFTELRHKINIVDLPDNIVA